MPRAHFFQLLRTMLVALILAQASLATGQPEDASEDHGQVSLISRLNARRLDWIAATDVWHHAGPALAWVNLQDTRMSPLVYSGLGPAFRLALDVERERWYFLPSITGRYARPTSATVLATPYDSYIGDADAALLYRFCPGRLAAGGAVRGTVNVRSYAKLQNNSFNSDLATTFDLVGRWDVPFALRARSMKFHLRADVPLLARISRSPAYGIYGSETRWTTTGGRYLRARMETGLTWRLRHSEENTARFGYVWDFYVLDPLSGLHPQRTATHTLSLTLGTRLM